MEAFTRLTGPALVLEQENIDTDQIIPARFLTATDFDGIGEHAFADWRFDADGKPLDHVLNSERASRSPILVAGHNFGCGSSREHAPHALLGFGFRVVISSQIADIFRSNIFRSNCQNVGLLPVVLEREQHARLLKMDGEDVTVDLEECSVDAGAERWSFEIDPFARHCLLRGLDRFDYLLQVEPMISAYEERM
jgi:3-isopropylmalate/(R)-2-methylmalate dehydratase small subunit